MVALKGITEEEERRALARHEQERQAVWSEPPILLSAPESVGFTDNDQFHEIKRRPGRQEAFRNLSVKTFQSREAANFIHEEMQLFRSQNGISRVREFVRMRFWEIAKRRYPAAKESIVWDRIRMNRKRF